MKKMVDRRERTSGHFFIAMFLAAVMVYAALYAVGKELGRNF